MRALWDRHKGQVQVIKAQRYIAPRRRQSSNITTSTGNVARYTQQANPAADRHCMAFQTLIDIMNPCSAFWRLSTSDRFRFVLGWAPVLGIGKRQVVVILGATITFFIAIVSSFWLF